MNHQLILSALYDALGLVQCVQWGLRAAKVDPVLLDGWKEKEQRIIGAIAALDDEKAFREVAREAVGAVVQVAEKAYSPES